MCGVVVIVHIFFKSLLSCADLGILKWMEFYLVMIQQSLKMLFYQKVIPNLEP